MQTKILLEVRHLSAVFQTPRGEVPVLDDVSFTLRDGEVLGLTGESGCGKTLTALSILGLVGSKTRVVEGEVIFDGVNLRQLSRTRMRRIRGREIAIAFQEPASALNPLMKIGHQLIEGMRMHLGLTRREAWARGVGLLQQMGIAHASRCMKAYPHELSGGMKQRVLIGMALSCQPRLLIVDEPTIGLDATTQIQVLDLLRDVNRQAGVTMLLISHDLGFMAQLADRVLVMYAGQIVEEGTTVQILGQPSHPYTRKLVEIATALCSRRGAAELPTIPENAPSFENLPTGCRFHPRCPEAEKLCTRTEPELISIASPGSNRSVRCVKRELERVRE